MDSKQDSIQREPAAPLSDLVLDGVVTDLQMASGLNLHFGYMSGFLDENDLSSLSMFEVTTKSTGYGNASATYGGVPVQEISSHLTQKGTVHVWDCLHALGGGGSSDKTTDRVFRCTERSINGFSEYYLQVTIE